MEINLLWCAGAKAYFKDQVQKLLGENMKKEAAIVVGVGIAAFVIYKFVKYASKEGKSVGLKKRDYPNP